MNYKLIELDSKTNQILFIPNTYAHGFFVKSKFVNLLYKGLIKKDQLNMKK